MNTAGYFGNTNRKTHGKSHSPEYNTWIRMRQRVLNTGHPRYRDWGGRGITICARWDRFENFLADMGPRPSGMSLDRANNMGDYKPSNCRWSTRSEQALNRRAKSYGRSNQYIKAEEKTGE